MPMDADAMPGRWSVLGVTPELGINGLARNGVELEIGECGVQRAARSPLGSHQG